MTQNTPPANTDSGASSAQEKITVETLDFREITRKSLSEKEELGEALVNKEGVHPLTDVKELVTTRIAPASDPGNGQVWDKHCYGLFAPDQMIPEAVVYVKLVRLPEVDEKIKNSDLPGNIQDILKDKVKPIENPNAAIFYTITNTARRGEPGYQSPKILYRTAPERLINKVADELKVQGIKCFSTLSPLRSGMVSGDTSTNDAQKSTNSELSGFSEWLSEFLTKEENTPVLTEQERKFLSEAMQGGSYDKLTEKEHKAIAQLMKRLACHYITNVKDVAGKNPKDPKNTVAKFHLGNGAEVSNIHYVTPENGATPSDKEGAYGIMVNYRYDLDKTDERKKAYQERREIAVDPELERDYQEYIAQLEKPRVKVKSVIPDENLRNIPPYEAYNR